MVARSPRATRYIAVLQAMSLPPSPAPIATGWSDSCRAGFAPAGERRLSTAHCFSGCQEKPQVSLDKLIKIMSSTLFRDWSFCFTNGRAEQGLKGVRKGSRRAVPVRGFEVTNNASTKSQPMTVLQRTDLTTSQKVQCAAAAVAGQHTHGSKTALSETYEISRPTVYAVGATAESVLRSHFEAPLLGGEGAGRRRAASPGGGGAAGDGAQCDSPDRGPVAGAVPRGAGVVRDDSVDVGRGRGPGGAVQRGGVARWGEGRGARRAVQPRRAGAGAIEGFNAALRPYLYVHKGATQGFLDLFRAWFNLRTRRWGRHKGTSAHQCLTGQRTHDWLTRLGYPPSPAFA